GHPGQRLGAGVERAHRVRDEPDHGVARLSRPAARARRAPARAVPEPSVPRPIARSPSPRGRWRVGDAGAGAYRPRPGGALMSSASFARPAPWPRVAFVLAVAVLVASSAHANPGEVTSTAARIDADEGPVEPRPEMPGRTPPIEGASA